jgi:hypothetical protein
MSRQSRLIIVRTLTMTVACVLGAVLGVIGSGPAEARKPPPGTWSTRVLPTVERSAVRCHARVQVRPAGSYVRCTPIRLGVTR